MISKSYRDMLKVSKMVSKQLRMGEEIVLDEGFSPKEIKMAIGIASDPRYKGGNYTGAFKAIEKIKKGLASHPQVAAVLKRQNENLDEKYDLYHKTFSDAMQHAYDYAKKKLGITVDPKEIDSKVATGPKKPSEGKTNKYRLKGKGGNLQIQVYNKGGSKPFELNMYKEENEMTKSLKDTIVEMWTDSITEKVEYVEYKFKNEKDAKAAKAYFDGIQLMSFEVNDDNIRGGELMVDAGKKDMTKFHKEVMKKFRPKVMTQEGFDSDAQRKAAFASGYKEKGKKKDKEEGNEFSGNLNKARKDGKKTFKVGDKEYPVKPAKKESVERYLETKKNSLRDAVLQMWGEGVNEEEKDKKTLTKEKKDGNVKKMTDTGKEMTPVETSVKMPKIKETKNKV